MTSQRLAVFIPRLAGGGAERAMLTLAGSFAARGHGVDLVVCTARGAFRDRVPGSVRLVELGPARTLAALPSLVAYLRRAQPHALLSALNHANLVAIWARRIAHVRTRIVISERSTPRELARIGSLKDKLTLPVMRRFYSWADDIVVNSYGVQRDLVELTGLPPERIRVLYNPVLTPELLDQAREAPAHAWFADDQPPVVLAVGRLAREKNFESLVRAFARVHAERPCRLIILGEGERRAALEACVARSGVEDAVALPGFDANPFAAMARASVVVLSSVYEGFPNVLAEALACGTTVVSTRCPSGPDEILDGGRFGYLVPCHDDEALAHAIVRALDAPFPADVLRARARDFSADVVAARYLELLQG